MIGSLSQGRNAQVRRVRLADGRRLRGRIFPEFTVFIPKNREYLAQFGGTKSFRGWGRQNGYKGRQINVRWQEKRLVGQKLQGAQKAYKKNQKKVATFFFFFVGDSKKFVLCRGAI